MTKKTTPQSAGGRAVAGKSAPAHCPRCGKVFAFGTPYMAYLGHLGLHGLADHYFNGDTQAAQRRLRENGLARQDPMPYNNAWPRYRPIKEGKSGRSALPHWAKMAKNARYTDGQTETDE